MNNHCSGIAAQIVQVDLNYFGIQSELHSRSSCLVVMVAHEVSALQIYR
jgi:hypothetical protein